MRNILVSNFIILIIAFFFNNCENKRKSIDTSANITPVVEKKVTIYGSENCDHCIEFRQQMDSIKFKYEFKDAEANEKNYQELLLKIQQANFKGYVSFPVIDIDGKIFVRPDFSEIQKLLAK